MFHSWANLGSNVHVVKSEVDCAYKVCVSLVKQLESDIAALAADNAAKAVADATAKNLKRDLDMIALTLRLVILYAPLKTFVHRNLIQ